MPELHIIVAIDRDRAIGRRGDLIYRVSEDLRRFKALTMGNTIVMGRRTWESLPKALPGRRNIVVTSNRDYRAEGAETASSLEEALSMAAEGPGDTYIIGGATLYNAAMDRADVLDLTVIDDSTPDADTFLAPIPMYLYKKEADLPAQTDPRVRFVTLRRK